MYPDGILARYATRYILISFFCLKRFIDFTLIFLMNVTSSLPIDIP